MTNSTTVRPSVRALLALAVATALLAVAGCGNSSGGSDFGAKRDSAVAALVPASIRAEGTLTVATDAEYAPNEFISTKSHQIEGMDIDLGNALAAVMGLKFHFVNAAFDSIIPGMRSGRYPIGMSSFTDTAQRQGSVDFVTYFTAGTSFYTAAKGGPHITGLTGLCGLKVGVESGTTQQADSTAQSKKCTSSRRPAVTVNAYQDQNQANLALSAGRVQVVMADSPVAAYAVKQSDGKFVLSKAEYGTAPYGIAIARAVGTPPGHAPMTKAVLAALKKLQSDGIYLKILNKWGVQSGAMMHPQVNAATS